MRCSVLAIDLLLFLPSILLAVKALTLLASSSQEAGGQGTKNKTRISKKANNSGASLLIMAFYPGLILIDNGHFQYNNASLGKTRKFLTLLLKVKG